MKAGYRMPFTIVVVTLLIAIMKDQVEHLNIIGVKRGSCEIVYWSPKSWLSEEWTKGLQEGKVGKLVAIIAIDEVHSIIE